MKSQLGRAGLATLCVALLILNLGGSLLSSTRTAQLETEMQQLAGRCRGLTLTVLKQLKAFDKEFRIGDEPDNRRLAEANQQLWKTKLLVDAFNGATAEFDDAEKKLSRLTGEATKDELAGAKELRALVNKYQRLISKYYGAAVEDFGEPVQRRPEYVSRSSDASVILTGEAEFGLGFSKYKRPTAGVDFGGADLQFGVQGTFKPAPGFNINALFKHVNDNEVVDYSQTDFKLNSEYFLTSYDAIQGGIAYQTYSVADDDASKYGEFSFHGDFNHNAPKLKLSAGFELRDRGYDIETQSYSTSLLHAQLTAPMEKGHFKVKGKLLSRSPDIDALKANDLDLQAELRVPSGGFEIGAEYRSVSHPDLLDELQGMTVPGLLFGVNQALITLPEDYSKLKARFEWLREGSANTYRRGFQGIWYMFPNTEDGDYYDIMYKSDGRARKDNRLKSNRMSLTFRLHQDSLAHDFLQWRWARDARPIGVGTYNTMTIVARAYTTFTDEDDPFRLAKLPPPHTVDLYWSFGWSKTNTGSLKNISIGPLVGASFAIDQQRQDAYDPDDVNYIFPNPANEAKVGVESRMVLMLSGMIRWNITARYEFQTYYAADPVRTKHNFVVRSTFGYRINKQWGIDGTLNIHETRVDVDSPADLNKYSFKIVAKYLFDVAR